MSIVSVTNVNVDLTGITHTLQGIINDPDTMLLVHARYAQILDPYVPYDTGFLSQGSMEIESYGVVYTAEYAWKQYYTTTFHHKTDIHPLATAYWDKVAMETHIDEFAEDVKEIIMRKYGNG